MHTGLDTLIIATLPWYSGVVMSIEKDMFVIFQIRYVISQIILTFNAYCGIQYACFLFNVTSVLCTLLVLRTVNIKQTKTFQT